MRAWISMLVVLVVLTTTYVWKKVELMRVSGQVNALKVQAEELREEQSRLMATVDLKKRPGAIVDAAKDRLGMIYHSGNAPELIVGTAAREATR
jgi:cell division protein FtsL